ncbi:TfoX/Sxy family protein [Oscillospiraceae bacterium 38-13]|jgi:DNA transformation protein
MPDLSTMKNIGKEMSRKLTAAGIRSSEELAAAGAKEAYLRLKLTYPNVCLVHLYVLEGAIRDVDYNRLPEEVKADLKEFSDYLKGKGGPNP